MFLNPKSSTGLSHFADADSDAAVDACLLRVRRQACATPALGLICSTHCDSYSGIELHDCNLVLRRPRSSMGSNPKSSGSIVFEGSGLAETSSSRNQRRPRKFSSVRGQISIFRGNRYGRFFRVSKSKGPGTTEDSQGHHQGSRSKILKRHITSQTRDQEGTKK